MEELSISESTELKDFVYKGLNAYYLWQNDVPNLQDTRFTNQNQIYNFVDGFATPEQLFESLLYRPTDRFSWIVDDYIALENSFQGVTLNNGMQFNLYTNRSVSGAIYAVVYYVIPNSDAQIKGVMREMVFSAVNGTPLTLDNYRDLLFGSATNYTINLADFNGGNPILNNTTINLTKQQLQENPVAITKVFNEGSHKIGYLLYNQFASNFDDELNSAFATFKSQNITDLVIDLRYNGGGRVSSAIYLGSMINGSNNGKVFSKQVWNSKFMKNVNPNLLIDNFTNKIVNKDSNGNIILDEPINSLSLQKVYFIVTEDTASASELVINAMDAYIDVVLVGTQTVGKQVGSITLYDSDDFTRNGSNFNRKHTYAMQPIVLEIKNSKGENDVNGYTADIFLAEDFGREDSTLNLGILGEKSEPLLEAAIKNITSGFKSSSKTTLPYYQKALLNSKFQVPFSQEMIIERFPE